ncbi:MAG TPA: hypothetical protein VN040_16080 [Pseudosphingobacterium sp.]|nr:hypothetical protein [Pseudosphingobacterium sp.]
MSKLKTKNSEKLQATEDLLRERHSSLDCQSNLPFSVFIHCADDVIINVQIESLQDPIKNIIQSPA